MVALIIVAAGTSRVRWLDLGLLLGTTRTPPAPPRVPECTDAVAFEADAFPWGGPVTLTDDGGRALTWTVCRVDGEVHISGTHPRWEVEHHARPDGTPLTTVHRRNGITTRISYSAEGAQVERTNAMGERSTVTIAEKGLWDGDSLDARLAGITWSNGKKVRMKIVDVDLSDGSVYPMVAEYVGQERCRGVPCHHVLLALDDFRRLIAPTFHYYYAVDGGAKYLQYDGDGLTFVARQEIAGAPARPERSRGTPGAFVTKP